MENITPAVIPNQETQVMSFNVETLISQAIEKNIPVENLERLLAFAKEVKAIQAKEQYTRAMAAFQAECPEIKKTKSVKTKSGVVAYSYAPIESIVEQVKPIIQKHGFSYSSDMELIENGTIKVKAIVKITHIDGHETKTEMTVPLGNKTDIMSQSQVIAAAQTFAKRYAFLNAFGIMTGDEDNDGQTDALAPKTPSQPKSSPQTGQNATLASCQRCKKNGIITGISPAVSRYSKEKYGFALCQPCQKLAQTAQTTTPTPKPPVTPKSSPVEAVVEEVKAIFPDAVEIGSPADLMKQGFNKAVKNNVPQTSDTHSS